MCGDDSMSGAVRRRSAPVGTVAVFAAAGLLFATSAEVSQGTRLRTDRTDLAAVIRAENAGQGEITRRLAELRSRIDAQEAAEARVNSEVAHLRTQAAALASEAGLASVSGRGLTITMTDAPRDRPQPPGTVADYLVVHQQDVQGVVNALWAGGAEAMMLMDQRVISTSAVRCVGNTLILQGRVYSSPFTISAIGDPGRLRAAMSESPTIPVYLEYAKTYGLGWKVDERDLVMPPFGGALELRYASVRGSFDSSASPAPPQGTAASASPVAMPRWRVSG
jgi:uncharacterized protein YlxW (UPF0749 family)